MDTKELRQKILDLAIRGKLVPQDPNDEPASVLLERIRAEKERLIAEGKIKRPKKSKASSAESHYQQLPDGWTSCTIDNLVKTVTDFVASGSFASLRENVKYFDSPNYAILVRTKDFQSKFTNGLVYTDKHGYEFLENSNLFGGELILPNIGASIGKAFIVPKLDYPMTLAPNSIMVKCWDEVTLTWLYYYFLSTFGQNALRNISGSTAQGKFNKTDFKGICIPVPPLNEQQKIVNQIISIETIINVITHNETILKGTIRSIKSKILDLAIQGKLVPQNPTDEPAADMLLRINPKAKIITDNPHSWNIPNSWCWTRVKDVFNTMEKAVPSGSEFLYIDIDSVDNRTNTVSPKQIKTEYAPSRASRKTQRGDIVFSMVRPYLRNVAVVPFDGCIASTGFYVLSGSSAIYPPFVFRFALSEFFVNGLNSYMKGDNSPSINKSDMEEFIIPLPPFNEQKRIISKIDDMYSLVDSIKASL